MSKIYNINKQMDQYKKAKQEAEQTEGDKRNNNLLVCTLAAYGTREMLRHALLEYGIRAETVYTSHEALVFELEPGGMSAVLYEMLGLPVRKK